MLYWRLRHTHLSWSGSEHLKPGQGYLVLANHSNLLDPAMLVSAAARPVHFLAADSVMRKTITARALRFFGSIPKKKFAVDRQAIRSLRTWASLGATVGLFPEGERSWDGHLLPLVPGVARMCRLIKAPIVTARIQNGDRVWPRWAPRPRRGRVHIEFERPWSWEDFASEEALEQEIRQRLTIPPELCASWPVHGRQLAAGLPNPLYACPSCGSFDALEARGDEIHCSHCQQRWRVDTHNNLHGIGSAPSLSIRAALAQAKARLDESGGDCMPYPLAGTLRHAHDQATWFESGDPNQTTPQKGRLEAHTHELRLLGEQPQAIPWEKIHAVSVDLRRILMFRAGERSLRVQLPSGSVLLWNHLCQALMDKSSRASKLAAKTP